MLYNLRCVVLLLKCIDVLMLFLDGDAFFWMAHSQFFFLEVKGLLVNVVGMFVLTGLI